MSDRYSLLLSWDTSPDTLGVPLFAGDDPLHRIDTPVIDFSPDTLQYWVLHFPIDIPVTSCTTSATSLLKITQASIQKDQ